MRTRIFGVTDGTAYLDCYHYPTISYYFLSSPLKETTDCGVWYFCDGGSSGSRGEGVGGVRGGDHLPRLSGTLPRLQDPPLPPLLLQGVRPTTGPPSRDQPPLCVPRVPKGNSFASKWPRSTAHGVFRQPNERTAYKNGESAWKSGSHVRIVFWSEGGSVLSSVCRVHLQRLCETGPKISIF